MKNLILASALLTGAVGFTACSSTSDSTEVENVQSASFKVSGMT